MGAQRLIDLDPAHRRRRLARAILVMIGTWVALVGLYYVLPFDASTAEQIWLRLTLGTAALIVVLVYLIRRIVNADFPQLRAVEAVSAIIPLFIVTNAGVYLFLSHRGSASFSQPLTHTSALYFTVTVLSTVGFGDITPTSDPARLIVTAQMLLDLVLVGSVIRLVAMAATRGMARHPSEAPLSD